MRLERILPFARNLLTTFVEKGGVAIDATCGNGHDTLYLANLVGPNGHVFAFDIQDMAIEATVKRLSDAGVSEQVTVTKGSHARVKDFVPAELHGKVQASIFNLGYLPGSDKSVVTLKESTIAAIQASLEITTDDGIVILVVYPGHEEGQLESEAVREFVRNLSQEEYHVLQYGYINQINNPPYILAIEKRK